MKKIWESINTVFFTLLAVVIIFVVASIEGSKEIKASNSDSGKLLNIWRVENNLQNEYPEEKTTLINYKNHEYYFIVSKINEEGEILEWYWAYDGGFDYIFQDYRYYVLVIVSLIFSLLVSNINYNTAVEDAQSEEDMLKTKNYYKDKKDRVSNFTQYIPAFCIYKNQQTYEQTKRDIIESADVNYDNYLSEGFDINKLEKWQIKRLKKIRKIKIIKIKANDLLQEHSRTTFRVRLLPESEEENKRMFFVKNVISKIISTGASGFIAGFGIIIGNWVMGITFAGTIIASAFSGSQTGKNYVRYKLRNRFIGKADLLNEFYNIKDNFMEEKNAPAFEMKYNLIEGVGVEDGK